MPAPFTVDSPDAAAALAAYLVGLDPDSYQRGEDYASGGRVEKVDRVTAERVRGVVRGGRTYFTDLLREGEAWRSRCTCPMEEDCKHAAALALLWLAHLSPKELPEVHAHAREAAPRPAPERVVAEKLGRPLGADELAFLGRLTALHQQIRQSGRVPPVELAKLGFATEQARQPPYKAAYEGWWPETPADPLALWQYIAHDIEASGLAVPEFMRPVTDTAGVRERRQNHERHEAVRRWNDRFSRVIAASAPAAPSSTAALLPPGTELRLAVGPKWILELRSRPDGPWKPAPRTVLETLAREPATTFLSLDLPPALFAFLAICSEHHARTFSLALNPGAPGGRELLHRLLFHRLARALVVGPGGEPFTFSDMPLAWRVERPSAGGDDYEISLLLPDGRPLPPGALHLPGKPDLYLHDRMVYVGPPALDGMSATAAIVPAEVIHRPDVLRTLRRLGTKLPPEIEARFISVPLRARVSCALADDFGGHEILLLQLHAEADQPPMEHVWHPTGWISLRHTPPHPPKGGPAPVYSYDFTLPDTVAARLRELGVGFDSQHQAWVRRVTRAFPEEFVEWREALPTDVEVQATGELASLLDAPVRARIDLQLVESAAHRDWFDLALALKPEDTTLTPAEIALLLRARGRLVRLPGKGWRRLSVELEGAPTAALAAAGFDPESLADAALRGERHRFHALQLAQSAMTDLLPLRQAEALRARARELAVPEPPTLPAGLRAQLRPYQREGFHFLAFLSANRLGGVLADDMGLGKTVQALAWLLWLAERAAAEAPFRALVVAPKSVVGNWQTEAARFTPALRVLRYEPGFAWEKTAAGPTIVVANYTQLRLAADFFRAQRWQAAILDEGQFIKTPSSKVAQVARDLPGEHRLVLTGTPIENRLLDLWSLFAFALPGLLGPQATFKRQFPQDNSLALARLRTRVRHFLLRRTKAQVATDLPPRTEEDILLDLEGEQERLYQAELKRARAQLLKIATPRQFDHARFNILASLMRLRQICCHPGLVDPAQRNAPSAKLDDLVERVTELRDEGHQVLVFSQFVEMLELIRARLVAEGVGHLMLTGQTEDRDALVARFQAEKEHTVFLLSLKAAGFGLNLTAASYVILYDPWWNPAVEAQAIDRTHRIGQSQPVNAYRLLARGTVEEKIRSLQREKASLAGAIVQEESLASMLDLESLRRILE